MNREDVHRAWAPANEPWSRWVKPVLFAHLDDGVAPLLSSRPAAAAPASVDWLQRGVLDPLLAAPTTEPHPYRAEARVLDTALVIDVAGADGVWLGVTAAALGWRPIPLYNAVPNPTAWVDLRPTMQALVDASERVAAAPAGAPPAFLLDAQRAGEAIYEPPPSSFFDNRSQHHASDFPSAETLWGAGIRRVVLIQAAPAPAFDLTPILLDWQARGLALWHKRSDEPAPATPFIVRRPSLWTRLVRSVAHQQLWPQPDGSYGHFTAGLSRGAHGG